MRLAIRRRWLTVRLLMPGAGSDESTRTGNGAQPPSYCATTRRLLVAYQPARKQEEVNARCCPRRRTTDDKPARCALRQGLETPSSTSVTTAVLAPPPRLEALPAPPNGAVATRTVVFSSRKVNQRETPECVGNILQAIAGAYFCESGDGTVFFFYVDDYRPAKYRGDDQPVGRRAAFLAIAFVQ